MYYPYLRGRQFELIALRELSEKDLLGNHITPVIEPVKLSSTLCSTIEAFIKSSKPISVIHNPTVGSFYADMEEGKNKELIERFLDLMKNPLVKQAHQMNPKSPEQLETLSLQGIEKKDLLVINNHRDSLEIYLSEFLDTIPHLTFVPDESGFKRRVSNRPKVIIDDKFIKQGRNIDYKELEDEFFSDDHLFYKDEGFSGFADYSIVGDEFSLKGFAPYAVAIHIVYFDQKNQLRIKHFVSDSNEDNKNPAIKFYEAVKSIHDWCSGNSIYHTTGLAAFITHFERGTYPGLGVAKKLSIMHHLELMGIYLDNING